MVLKIAKHCIKIVSRISKKAEFTTSLVPFLLMFISISSFLVVFLTGSLFYHDALSMKRCYNLSCDIICTNIWYTFEPVQLE